MIATDQCCKAHCFVLTGGPGAGKTTVLAQLEKMGYACMPEVARQIIREQVAAGGDGVPWQNMPLYTRLMQTQTIAAFDAAPPAGTCFYDRGIPDVICHAQLNQLPVDASLHAAAGRLRYNRQVFLFPPWEEIYHTDTERKQTFAEAVRTCEVLQQVYQAYDYELVEVPKGTVMERAAFILARIALSF